MKELGRSLFKSFNTGISYFLPVIIASGMLFSFTLVTGNIVDGQIIPSNQFFTNLYDLAMAGFTMMVPVLCAYIAYSIGSKPALAPAFILGYVANKPIGESQIATGFIGAIILGFLVGYVVKWVKKWKVPTVIQPLMPTFLVPLFTTLIIGVGYIYLLVYPLNGFVQLMVQTLTGLSGVNAALLGIGIGILAAADMGGPCSKAATAFTLALMAEGIYGPNGAFRLCCAVPPLGLALATFIIRNRFTQEEKQFGISALFLSMAGITEGAIPFAGKDFKRVFPAIIIGTSVSGLLGMIHGVESVVAFGGLVSISGVTKGAVWYAVDMFIGALVIVGYLFLTRPKLEVDGIKEEKGE
ncbi:PTS fructose transporter subunit IIC [Anaerosacchariphilus polymeriproducens]|uniref:PTS fructose transporter subunit IIABC n=1 Tax=Anaerosacchariphilus polymeriproducens TaxID=1812858 RepID=A0A371ASF2_9FIRM|nr:PTS fructose transporter subunit IIC [Anaerosacchariphilus polymeriproducens]RDU22497.1 PTS fructose transporter subunit IIABC [Anaerosacchariphilus polymeriproducens]